MILITGCAGFIGSHLSQRLLMEGYDVTGIDNFDSFYARDIKEGNLSYFKSDSSFDFHEMDIRSDDFRTFVCDTKPEVIVHLAAMAGVRPSIEDPGKYLDVNVSGTLNLLEAVRTYSLEHFVFASSSSVYGGNKKIPYSETDPVDSPVSPYAATKKMCELLIYNYHHLYGIPSSLHRFFTVYGPRQRPEMAIHKFVRAIYADEPLTLFGDGTSSRDYTYITDIINGLVNSIERPQKYEIFNLGNSYTISLSGLIDLLEETIGKPVKREYYPFQPGDVMKTWSDIDKSRKILDYEPVISIGEGVRKFVKWYENKMLSD